jgi:hypothetical protein
MIKAIDTRYGGYLFRSRLEARWAVFFDKLGLKWEYEPEGFDIDGLWYLPDFRVQTPQGEPIWYEVKPEGAQEDAKFTAFKKALHAANVDGLARAEILAGDPVNVLASASICPRCGLIHQTQGAWADYCYPCDLETPSGGGNDLELGFLGLPVRPHKGMIETDARAWRTAEANTLLPAAQAARSARFEHGAKQ